VIGRAGAHVCHWGPRRSPSASCHNLLHRSTRRRHARINDTDVLQRQWQTSARRGPRSRRETVQDMHGVPALETHQPNRFVVSTVDRKPGSKLQDNDSRNGCSGLRCQSRHVYPRRSPGEMSARRGDPGSGYMDVLAYHRGLLPRETDT